MIFTRSKVRLVPFRLEIQTVIEVFDKLFFRLRDVENHVIAHPANSHFVERIHEVLKMRFRGRLSRKPRSTIGVKSIRVDIFFERILPGRFCSLE